MNGTVSRSEWRWVGAISLAVVILSSIPYAAGYLVQNPDARFVGSVLDLEDYHSHLAKMWQGYRGRWEYQLLFTPEVHDGVYLQSFYVALGHLARITGLSVQLMYHLARMMAGLLLLPTVYWFVAVFAAGKVRRTAFLLAAISSGLGWLVEALHPTPAGGVSPIDFWLIDAYTFFSLFAFPHFSIAITFLLGLFGILLQLTERADGVIVSGASRSRLLALVVVLSWGLGIIHPYALLLADLIPAIYLFWVVAAERRVPSGLLVALVLMGLAQVPILLYDLYAFSVSPVFGAWAAQNETLSPSPLSYALGYGLVAILAACGIRPALKLSTHTLFLLAWVATVFVLIYLPWRLQRRFLEGLHVGLCVLAAYGLMEGVMPALARPLGRLARLVKYSPARLRWVVRALILASTAFSNLYLISDLTLASLSRDEALFRSAVEVSAVDWLNEHSDWDETILAAYQTGNWIAGEIGHRVVLGHWAETVDHAGKQTAVARFFSANTPDAERMALLKRWGISYVFYGPNEREMGACALEPASYLEQVFQEGDVTVYRVVR